jgi:hypothetical protein
MTEAVCTSETSVNIYLTTWQYVPEDFKLQNKTWLHCKIFLVFDNNLNEPLLQVLEIEYRGISACFLQIIQDLSLQISIYKQAIYYHIFTSIQNAKM